MLWGTFALSYPGIRPHEVTILIFISRKSRAHFAATQTPHRRVWQLVRLATVFIAT